MTRKEHLHLFVRHELAALCLRQSFLNASINVIALR
jgi:hypothetical protein